MNPGLLLRGKNLETNSWARVWSSQSASPLSIEILLQKPASSIDASCGCRGASKICNDDWRFSCGELSGTGRCSGSAGTRCKVERRAWTKASSACKFITCVIKKKSLMLVGIINKLFWNFSGKKNLWVWLALFFFPSKEDNSMADSACM